MRLSRKEKILLIIIGIPLLIFFYSYMYHDIIETAAEGIRFWDILFSGKICDFYHQVFLIDNVQYYPQYDFPMYIIFALWNFPLWVLEKVFHSDIYHSILCMMWMKTMLLVFCGFFGASFNYLCDALNFSISEKKIGILLFFTSGFFATSVIILGQYDIMSVILVNIGVASYIKEKYKNFIIFFALAVPLKAFSLLIFVPLLLLKEKRIYAVVLNFLMVYLPNKFIGLIVPIQYYIPGKLHVVAGAIPDDDYNHALFPGYAVLFNHGTIAFGEVFPFIVVEIVFLLFCFAFKLKDNDLRNKWIIYVCFAAYAIQFTFAYSHPYWFVMLIPFIIIIIIQNQNHMETNIITETVLTYGMILAQAFYFTWCFESSILNLSFWSRILSEKDQLVSVMTVAAKYVIDERLQNYATGIGLSIYVAGLAFFAIANFPWWSAKFVDEGQINRKIVCGVRTAAFIITVILPMLLFFYGRICL